MAVRTLERLETSLQRRYSDHLAENYFNTALAVHYIFEKVLSGNWDNSVVERSKHAIRKLNLDSENKKQIMCIASNIEKVIELTKRIKYRFGVTSQKYIKDKKAFLKFVDEKDASEIGISYEDIDIRVFRLAIGFYINNDIYRKKYGKHEGFTFRLDRNINEYLKRGFTDPLQYVVPRSNDSGPSKSDLVTRTELHEIRHVVDNIIGTKHNIVTYELSALTYENENNVQQQIFNNIRSECTEGLAIVKNLQLKGLEKQISHDRDLFLFQTVYFMDRINLLQRKGLDSEIISFIVSLAGYEKLGERLELINDFFK